MGDGGGVIALEIEGDYSELLAYPGAWMVINPNGSIQLWHPDKFNEAFERNPEAVDPAATNGHPNKN